MNKPKSGKTAKPAKPKILARRWKIEDLPQIAACYEEAYPEYKSNAGADLRHYDLELKAFPEGQFLVEVDGKVVAYATSLIVQLDEGNSKYSYDEITGGHTFNTHNPSGDTLYGADIAVVPEFRGQGIAARLYKERKKLVRRYNLRRMVAYGRIPGYEAFSKEMLPEQYVAKVVAGEMKDSALTAHLKAGYRVIDILMGFFSDRASLHYATMLEWENPDHDPEKRRIAAAPLKGPNRKVRVGAAQFLMRRIKTWEEFEHTLEFFVDSANAYHCHFLVLPELFTAQLFSIFPNDMSFEAAIDELVDLTPKYLELCEHLATSRQLYLIAGSHPVRRDGKLYNVSHFFTPSGRMYTQDKLHITPGESEEWNISPGESIQIFDTPLGRIAIQICYDIEFPEISRLLGLRGVDIIFVPFSTDDKKAYNRVRYCAQARAIENCCYVVLAGNVGTLPTITNYLLNYGQSAILTPSDLNFPTNAVAGEADPNVETMVVAELDLTSVNSLRNMGTVKPLHDRRLDLYSLESRSKINLIRTE
jgi:predicted amidohydrolase/GNAT superfamily N-acetyltransferase